MKYKTMKKKKYLAPRITVIKLESANQMLASSGGDGPHGGDGSDPTDIPTDPSFSKQTWYDTSSLWDEED